MQRLDTDRVAYGALAAIVVVGAWAILAAGSGLTFFFDEWNLVVNRGGHSLDVFLRPHNEHASTVGVLIYKALFETAGLGHYGVYRLVGVLLMELLAGLVYVYARPRLGRWWALFPASALVMVGAAPEHVLQPFQMTFTLSLVGALVALLAFDRGRDRLASAGLVVSLFSSSVALGLFGAFVLELVLRRDRRRAVRVLAAPAVLYGAWWIGYSTASTPLSNLPHVLGFMEVEYVTAVRGLTTLTVMNAAAALLLLGVTVVAACGSTGLRPRFWFAVAAPLAYWLSTALLRYGESPPDTQRYIYPGVLMLALLVCELGAGRRLPAFSARVAVVAGALLVALLLDNAGQVDEKRGTQSPQFARILRPELGALELARGAVRDPGFAPDPLRAPDLTAANYLAALDRYPGSPGASPEEIAAADVDARAAADMVLFGAVAPTVEPADRACAATPETALDLTFASALLVTARRAPVTVTLRRFGDAPAVTLTVAARAAGRVALPAADAHPYRAQLSSAAPFAACA